MPTKRRQRTRYEEKVLTVEVQIAARSRKHWGKALTNLYQFIDEDFLEACYYQLNKQSAAGVDGESWKDYQEQMKERIPQLLKGFRSGTYKAPPIRRVYIPKEDGTFRPLGIPTIEDKLLQTAVSKVLSPIYENEFYSSSYGFRPGKSQHDAINNLFEEVSFKGKRYIIDADIKNYFGTINLVQLREFLDRRIKDGVIRKMVDKWLKAGIREEQQITYSAEGTPQGGSISPLLSNIFLHYVLDEWFIDEIQPKLKRKSFIIRYADDFLLGFEQESDARRVMEVLSKRFQKYGIELHPDKTKLIVLKENTEEPDTFDFLGFTHYMGRSQKGKAILKRHTSKKKFKGALKRYTQWLCRNRHTESMENLIKATNRKLEGHYQYYGITFNSRAIGNYFHRVKGILFRWLNRRGGKRKLNWPQFHLRTIVWCPLSPPRIKHSYLLAKP